MSLDDLRRSEIRQGNAAALEEQWIAQSDAIQQKRLDELTPNAGNGIRFGGRSPGLQLTPGAVATFNEGVGEYALKRIRDEDVLAQASRRSAPSKLQVLGQSEINPENYPRSVGSGSSGDVVPYDTRLKTTRFTNARQDIIRTAQTDRVGDWIRSLNLPEIPGVGWLSRDQAIASSQHWASRLDETGNPLYAIPQGVATLWADHAEEVGMALSIRGGGRGVKPGDSGAFGSLKGVKGDELTAHHMPQAAAGRTGYNEGGALVLTHAEHTASRTYGSKGMATLQSDAKLSFREVLARDIADIRSIVGSKYNEGLRNLTEYYRKNFPELMTK